VDRSMFMARCADELWPARRGTRAHGSSATGMKLSSFRSTDITALLNKRMQAFATAQPNVGFKTAFSR
jgi:hypothetical protein